jgi:hypothetical protein
MANASVLFERYTAGYNLAESYAMASRYCSWMDVVVGDPKTSLANPPLPVQLVSFRVTPGAGGLIRLTWETLSEVNNFGFFPQRRGEAEPEFYDLAGAFLPGHGTSVARHQYTLCDSSAGPGVLSYRLRQVDLDGAEHFSEPVTVEHPDVTAVGPDILPPEFRLDQNFPNPFNPRTSIRYALPRASEVRVSVFSMLGEHICTLVHGVQPAGEHTIQFEPSADLSSGSYVYALQAGGRQEVKHMMYLK